MIDRETAEWYELGVMHPPNGDRFVVAMCQRDHAVSGGWVGAVVNDLENSSTVMLVDVIDLVNEHEKKEHGKRRHDV